MYRKLTTFLIPVREEARNDNCQCLCAPSGHDPVICTVTAVPGLYVPLVPGSETAAPACRQCHQATVRHILRTPDS